MDLELCFSRDRHAWVRPLRGGWVPRGGTEETDYMSVYDPNRLMDMGGHWRLLYRAGNEKHNRGLPGGVKTARRETMVADAPKGRFAGLRTADHCIGALTLDRFNHTGRELVIDGAVSERLQAELRDPYGRPLPGYERNTCEPIRGDSQQHVLRCTGGKKAEQYRYAVVGRRIEIEDGVIYSVGFEICPAPVAHENEDHGRQRKTRAESNEPFTTEVGVHRRQHHSWSPAHVRLAGLH